MTSIATVIIINWVQIKSEGGRVKSHGDCAKSGDELVKAEEEVQTGGRKNVCLSRVCVCVWVGGWVVGGRWNSFNNLIYKLFWIWSQRVCNVQNGGGVFWNTCPSILRKLRWLRAMSTLYITHHNKDHQQCSLSLLAISGTIDLASSLGTNRLVKQDKYLLK